MNATLPASRFYWAVLDASGLARRGRRRRTQLGYLFESDLPCPIERVHAVYLPLARDRVLACGMDRDELAGLRADDPLTLGPDEVPARLGVDITPGEINLLVGEAEPRAVTRARGRLTLTVALALMACAGAVSLGLARRADALGRHASRLELATDRVCEEALGPSTSTVPTAARLVAELRTLEQTRDRDPERAFRAAPTLAALLRGWPADLPATTRALAVSPTVITLEALLPGEAEAERLERELAAPEGWRLAQPAVRREREGVVVRWRLEPGGAP